MNSQYKERTDQKLRYAKIHFEELKNYLDSTSNDEWENSHQESCFFHLAASIESMLHEINAAYSLKLHLHNVRWDTVSNTLKKNDQVSLSFNHLESLRKNKKSWLALLFEWRNHGTHRGRIGKIVNLSNVRLIDNEFKDPRSGEVQKVYAGSGCLDVIKNLVADVEELINNCRKIDSNL
ncbi:MAG: hypothetical protein D8M58_21805 [Calditrichaeota bacterium]|nr:MAG: hypothetical protein DWQ03_00670 [Calditrichota bacterium]MBL1208051.1 hypothetical protein [Calditrichota bacterium]NOG47886.1 hypothetical protein [Calditrichota bacterium]